MEQDSLAEVPTLCFGTSSSCEHANRTIEGFGILPLIFMKVPNGNFAQLYLLG